MKTLAPKDTLLPEDLHFEVCNLPRTAQTANCCVPVGLLVIPSDLASCKSRSTRTGRCRPQLEVARRRNDCCVRLAVQAKQLAELFLKPGRPVTRSMTRAARGEAADGGAEAGYASSDNGGGGFGESLSAAGQPGSQVHSAHAPVLAIMPGLTHKPAETAVETHRLQLCGHNTALLDCRLRGCQRR